MQSGWGMGEKGGVVTPGRNFREDWKEALFPIPLALCFTSKASWLLLSAPWRTFLRWAYGVRTSDEQNSGNTFIYLNNSLTCEYVPLQSQPVWLSYCRELFPTHWARLQFSSLSTVHAIIYLLLCDAWINLCPSTIYAPLSSMHIHVVYVSIYLLKDQFTQTAKNIFDIYWTEVQSRRRKSSLGSSEFHFNFWCLLIIWYCWFHQSVIFSLHGNGL